MRLARSSGARRHGDIGDAVSSGSDLNTKFGKDVNSLFAALAVEDGEHNPLDSGMIRFAPIAFQNFSVDVFAIRVICRREIFIQ